MLESRRDELEDEQVEVATLVRSSVRLCVRTYVCLLSSRLQVAGEFVTNRAGKSRLEQEEDKRQQISERA